LPKSTCHRPSEIADVVQNARRAVALSMLMLIQYEGEQGGILPGAFPPLAGTGAGTGLGPVPSPILSRQGRHDTCINVSDKINPCKSS